MPVISVRFLNNCLVACLSFSLEVASREAFAASIMEQAEGGISIQLVNCGTFRRHKHSLIWASVEEV